MGGRTGAAGMQAKSNMTGMKGQLGLRSSALAPTSAKLTTQYLVLDHMNNHYSKIVNAKSAIDNRPPKALATSQKCRDRKVRDYVKKTGVRPGSSMNVRPNSRAMYYDDPDMLNEEAMLNDFDPEDDDDRLVLDIMKTTLKSRRPGQVDSTEATYGGSESVDASNLQGRSNQSHYYHGQGSQNQQYEAYSHQPQYNSQMEMTAYPRRPRSVRSARSTTSGVSRSALVQADHHGKRVEDGDILAKRSHVFTEPDKPFTPRTLKSTRTSKLSQCKFYTAPPQKRKDTPEQKKNREPEDAMEETSVAPKPKPRPRTRSPLNRTETPLSETTLMYESLQSRDFSKYNKLKMVPTLDISMDKDHLNWIKEQASKAEVRAKSSSLKSTMGKIKENDMLDDTTDMGQTGFTTTDGSLGRTTRSFGTRTMGSGRLNDQEEELKYVEFMKEVTNDVLNRGVFTNRVLKQVFKTHIEKRKGELNEFKMRGVLDQIRRDLEIPNDPDTDVSSYSETPMTSSSSQYRSLGYPGKTTDFGMSRQYDRTFASTMDSQNTYGLQSTSGDMFSTINSELERDEMSNTQALQSYQLDLTRKEAIEERSQEEEEEDNELSEEREFEQNTRMITVTSKDTDNESVHSSASKSRIQRNKPSRGMSGASGGNISDHSQASRARDSEALHSKPSSVISVASREDAFVHSGINQSKPRGVISVAPREEVQDNSSVYSQASKSSVKDFPHRPSSVKSAASQEYMEDRISHHSSENRLKYTPQPRQSIRRTEGVQPSATTQSVVSHGEETDDTLTRDHSQVLSDGETEDGAYGGDEFEESEAEDNLGTATHRTSDDDF